MFEFKESQQSQACYRRLGAEAITWEKEKKGHPADSLLGNRVAALTFHRRKDQGCVLAPFNVKGFVQFSFFFFFINDPGVPFNYDALSL